MKNFLQAVARTLQAQLSPWFAVFAWAILIAPPSVAAPVSPTVTVFAASSLKESLDAIAAAWLERSGQKVVVSYAASSALARQIEQGAPADIYIPADGEWMDYLQKRQLIVANTRVDLVRNRLVLIAPVSSPARQLALQPGPLQLALGAGRLAVAETSNVPAGRYARQSLQALGLWPTVRNQLAQGDNVRAALAYVARGEAPLGIVYATDARAEPGVRVLAIFPDDSHAPIIYPAARLSAAPPARSAGFLAWLQSDAAKRIFVAAGFSSGR